jgi:retinol dehydrogenase 12
MALRFLYSQLLITPAVPSTDFSNQTVIVTGSNVGLGLEAARHFTRLNAAKVVLAVRNLEQGNEAKESIEASTGRRDVVEVRKLDLSSFESVKAFAKNANAELDRCDVLLLNASIAANNMTLLEGYESSITVNVISTFLLLFMMFPLLQKTAKMSPPMPPRVCVVASEVHGYVTLPSEDFPGKERVLEQMSKEENVKWDKRYSESKLLQVLVLRAITPKLNKEKGVVINMLNPGLCQSKLNRDGSMVLEVMKFFLARSTEVGSRTLLASAGAGWESHGTYMSDAVVRKEGDADGLSPFSRSEDGGVMGERIWAEVRSVLERESPGCTKVLDE